MTPVRLEPATLRLESSTLTLSHCAPHSYVRVSVRTHKYSLVGFFEFPKIIHPPNNFFIFIVFKINYGIKVRKRAKISNRYNSAPHLTQDTNWKVTTSQLNFTNESQEVSPFSADDHKALINRHTRKHYKNKSEIT